MKNKFYGVLSFVFIFLILFSNISSSYHPDHLGSTSLVTNQSGDIVEEESSIFQKNIL